MTKFVSFKPEFVESVEQDAMVEGVLYISERFQTTLHKCFCGCGFLTVMPFGDNLHTWSLLIENDGSITMRPSVGNFNSSCRSHYYLTANTVDWELKG